MESVTKFNSITVDSTNAVTGLCSLGARYGTDKSPYQGYSHRHAYTAIYELLFASKRYDAIHFAEIGILENSSMKMWRSYFKKAKLFGFDFSGHAIQNAQAHGLYDTEYHLLDTGEPSTIINAFKKAGGLFDVIIDDASHLFEHQVAVALAVPQFLKPGGIFIIEDCFRSWPNSRYEDALQSVTKYFDLHTFVLAEHENQFSEGTQEPWFDNDKILVMYRNDTPPDVVAPPDEKLHHLEAAQKRLGFI